MRTLPISQVKADLSKLVDDVVRNRQRVEIAIDGRRAAVLLGVDEYDSMLESLAILGDPRTLTAIRRGTADARAGPTSGLDEAARHMRARGRRPGSIGT